jgi:thymidylate synthase (FAD)
MKIIEQSYEIVQPYYINNLSVYLKGEAHKIELAARDCYQSANQITDDSYIKMLTNLKEKQHFAMFEFGHLHVRFITSRGVSHEFVRHRMSSFAQESTRYCNYSKDKFTNEITVIKPTTWDKYDGDEDNKYGWSGSKHQWKEAMEECEDRYFRMLQNGCSPQQARGVLPNDLKTTLNVSTNFREWLHIFELRCSEAAHPDIRNLLTPLRDFLAIELPCIFG